MTFERRTPKIPEKLTNTYDVEPDLVADARKQDDHTQAAVAIRFRGRNSGKPYQTFILQREDAIQMVNAILECLQAQQAHIDGAN